MIRLIRILLLILAFSSAGVSVWLHAVIPFTDPSFSTTAATILWIVSIASFGAFTLTFGDRNTNAKAPGSKSLRIFIWSIFAIALFFRLYKVTHQGINSDEWFWLMQAKEILHGRFLSPFGFIGDQPSNLPVYPVAAVLLATANNYLAVRLPGILYSLGTLLFVYLLLKQAVSPKAAIAGLILLATSVWDIHNSQIGLQNVTINPFLISGFMYFLHTGYVKRSHIRMFAAGLFLGISLNLLYVAALSVVAFAVYGIAVILKERGMAAKLFLVAFVSCILTFAPTIPKILRYPDRSIGRHEKFTMENVEHSVTEGKLLPLYYGEQAMMLFKDFGFRQNAYGVSYLWGITLEPLVTALVLIGALTVIAKVFQPFEFLVTAEFILMAVPVVILYRATSIWREYGFVPVIYLWAGIGFDTADRILKKLVAGIGGAAKLLPYLYVAMFAVSFFAVFRLYQRQYLSFEPYTYETHCKHVYEMLSGMVQGGETVFFPDELCAGYASLFLPASVTTDRYAGSAELMKRFAVSAPAVAVKLDPGLAMSDFQRAESIAGFLSVIIAGYPQSQIRYVTGRDGTIEAAIVSVP